MIGAWGSLVFTVSYDKVRTFDGFKRDESSRWSKHDIHLKKPKPEFQGDGQGRITFTMQFLASKGVHPMNEIDALIRSQRAGEVHTLVIGTKRFGVHKWYISSLSMDMKTFDNRGNLLSASVNVTMEEYV